MGYITNFIVYTLAMVGVIVVALLVYKNATSIGNGKTSKYLKIIDSISLGQRKNLYIVSTGKEQFLIAGDVNNTCLISKLEGLGVNIGVNIKGNKIESLSELQDVEYKKDIKVKQPDFNTTPANSFQDTLINLQKPNYMDKSNIGIKTSLLREKTKTPVMKNIAEIMKN